MLLKGRGISPGLARGKAFLYEDVFYRQHDCYEIKPHQMDEEVARIEAAVGQSLADLDQAIEDIERKMGAEHAAILAVQQTMLRDPQIQEDLQTELRCVKINAEQVVKRVFRRWEKRMRSLKDPAQRQRGDDVRDAGRRVLHHLLGIAAHALEHLPEKSVLVAKRLLPSDTVALSRISTTAVVVEVGGPTSHAALMTRELGIPAVTQIDRATRRINMDDELQVDGYAGTVEVNPPPSSKAAFTRRMTQYRSSMTLAREHRQEPAVTQDGVRIEVLANVGCREDALSAVENGAEGAGLYRIENIYLARNCLPTSDEIEAEIRATLTPFGDKPVVVRLLDIGGDKTVGYLDIGAVEPDPFLGRRGIRVLMAFPELLKDQLRAMVRIAQEFDLRLLLPMITFVEEVEWVRGVLDSVVEEMQTPRAPLLGAMVETPAAALCVSDLVRHSDFLSVGTNDLTQYTLAVGRESTLISEYFRENHPAVLRLLGIILAECGDTPVSLCGELAGRAEMVQTLLRIGFRCLSVAPPSVAAIKQIVRESSIGEGHG